MMREIRTPTFRDTVELCLRILTSVFNISNLWFVLYASRSSIKMPSTIM